MKRFARISKLELGTPDEELLKKGMCYEIVSDTWDGCYINASEEHSYYFISNEQYTEVSTDSALPAPSSITKETPSELTLGMLLSKLNEDASVNLEISFEDKATKIVSENYYKDELKDYFDRVVKWYSPDTVVDGLSILLEGEFSNGN
ncbi:hypothetical protein LMOIWNZ_00050 [Enterococcus phage vB_OCPT_CCS3]|nr:hypothetical protein LMOIWNZ_00050 [Enterococcus phage vB_OCPT_CCS3]